MRVVPADATSVRSRRCQKRQVDYAPLRLCHQTHEDGAPMPSIRAAASSRGSVSVSQAQEEAEPV